jgi:hypothetical protein
MREELPEKHSCLVKRRHNSIRILTWPGNEESYRVAQDGYPVYHHVMIRVLPLLETQAHKVEPAQTMWSDLYPPEGPLVEPLRKCCRYGKFSCASSLL